MTKNEQNRVLAWRLKLLHEASVIPRNVAQACRHFGLSSCVGSSVIWPIGNSRRSIGV
jgi:hypothetical protein